MFHLTGTTVCVLNRKNFHIFQYWSHDKIHERNEMTFDDDLELNRFFFCCCCCWKSWSSSSSFSLSFLSFFHSFSFVISWMVNMTKEKSLKIVFKKKDHMIMTIVQHRQLDWMTDIFCFVFLFSFWPQNNIVFW